MPSDFGDESGEKLFDWMLRIGQDASEAALLTSAERLKGAFKNARGEVSRAAEGKATEHDALSDSVGARAEILAKALKAIRVEEGKLFA